MVVYYKDYISICSRKPGVTHIILTDIYYYTGDSMLQRLWIPGNAVTEQL